jgi:hypothetical protein
VLEQIEIRSGLCEQQMCRECTFAGEGPATGRIPGEPNGLWQSEFRLHQSTRAIGVLETQQDMLGYVDSASATNFGDLHDLESTTLSNSRQASSRKAQRCGAFVRR